MVESLQLQSSEASAILPSRLAGAKVDEAVKEDLVCELDACVALLYGLDEDDLAVIYEPFSETVDYSERHAAVLGHFRCWRESA